MTSLHGSYLLKVFLWLFGFYDRIDWGTYCFVVSMIVLFQNCVEDHPRQPPLLIAVSLVTLFIMH